MKYFIAYKDKLGNDFKGLPWIIPEGGFEDLDITNKVKNDFINRGFKNVILFTCNNIPKEIDWGFVNKHKIINMEEINIEDFKNELKNRIVEFKYSKKNGDIRIARGTLNVDIMGNDNIPKGTGYDIKDNNIRYYDLNSNGWRSFLLENLIEWN